VEKEEVEEEELNFSLETPSSLLVGEEERGKEGGEGRTKLESRHCTSNKPPGLCFMGIVT